MTHKVAPAGKRVKAPTVIQMEAVECGAASLGMVLGYYGRAVPLEELRVSCGVSRDGAKAANILTAAAQYGLEAHAFKRDIDALRQLVFPVIVFWNFNHFVVVEGFGKDKVYLNNPAVGRQTVTLQEFSDSFTGVVLTFAPTSSFQEQAATRTFWTAVRRRMGTAKGALAYAVLAGALLVVPGISLAAFTRILVDDILIAGRADWLAPLLLAMLVTAAVSAGLTWLQQYYLLRLETEISLRTSSQFLWHLLRLPVEFYDQRFGGSLVTRVQSNDTIAQLLSGQFATAMINVLGIVFYAVVMATYDVVLTLVGIAFAVLNFVALRYISQLRVERNQLLVQEQSRLVGASFTGVTTIETLKATGSETDFFSRWAGFQTKMVNAEQKLGTLTQSLNVVPSLLAALSTATILFIGGFRVIQGDLTFGMLVAFQGLMASFLLPFGQLVTLGSALQDAHGQMDMLDDVMENKLDDAITRPAPPIGPNDPVKLSGALEMRNITFGYNKAGPPLITDFSLKVNPGDRVAIIGSTGAGKSTMGSLIVGLLEPWSGEVLFDGKPRNDINHHIITNSVGRVSQDIFLFEGSVRENLTLWDPSVPEAEIVQAASDACVHNIIAARAGAYSSQVAEDGRNFSGGERQRLELARALAADPSILVLDEATAALDPATELEIDNNLRRRGYTCVIVAHRLSTIRDCNEIIVLDKGKVVQRGTHDNLIAQKDGLYAQLILTA